MAPDPKGPTMATALITTMRLHQAEPRPLTSRTDAQLAALAQRVERDTNNAQSDCWTYVLPDHRTVTLVVSRSGGRIVRGIATSPHGPVAKFTGTSTQVAHAALAFAA